MKNVMLGLIAGALLVLVLGMGTQDRVGRYQIVMEAGGLRMYCAVIDTTTGEVVHTRYNMGAYPARTPNYPSD